MDIFSILEFVDKKVIYIYEYMSGKNNNNNNKTILTMNVHDTYKGAHVGTFLQLHKHQFIYFFHVCN